MLTAIDFEIIFTKSGQNGRKTETYLINNKNRTNLKAYNEKNVVGISGKYFLLTEDHSEGTGVVVDWRSNKINTKVENIYRVEILDSKELGLLILRARAELQGIPDSTGMRRMYGYSYQIDSLKTDKENLKELMNVRHGGLYLYRNDLIYLNHDQCTYSREESGDYISVEQCKTDPGTNIVIKNKVNGQRKIISKNSSNAILLNDNLYFINSDNKIVKFNLLRNTSQVFLNEKIERFKISKNEKYLLIQSMNNLIFGNSSFLVLIDVQAKKRLILDEGQIIAFDILDQ